MHTKKLNSVLVSLFFIFITSITFADWKEDAKVIKISGGEYHTLVLTKNKWAWGCGDNEWYQLGIGDTTDDQPLLVRVHKGDMNSSSDYLEDINDIDAGWTHSLALDVNRFVWAWGNNSQGQLGNDSTDPCSTPVQVLSGEQDPNDANSVLQNIVAVSAGWDHCMALEEYEAYDYMAAFFDPNYAGPDPNFQGRVYTWGNNGECYGSGSGRLGNGTMDDSSTPILVLSG